MNSTPTGCCARAGIGIAAAAWLIGIAPVSGAAERKDQEGQQGQERQERREGQGREAFLVPVVECVANNGDGSYTASFGYENRSSRTATVRVGESNRFSPKPENRGQPTRFVSGRQRSVFAVKFDGAPLSWHLGVVDEERDREARDGDSPSRGLTAIASRSSPPCSTTPPKIVVSGTPPPDAAGWNNTNVAVSFVCTPGSAPITSCPPPTTVSAEGGGQVISGTVTDASGRSASASVTLNIDKTAPAITASAAPPANAAGWNTSNVSVAFQCSDGLSGISVCPAPVSVQTEGANQQIKGTATDKAGNSASATVTLNIDRTAPAIATSVSPLPNGSGWNNTDVTVTFNCSDSGSGLARCPPPVRLISEGVRQLVSGTAADIAGNTASASATVSVDKTPPTVSIASPGDGALASSSPQTVRATVADALSGIATVTCNGIPASGSNGSVTCDVPLSPGSNAIVVRAADAAGNASSASVTVSFSAKPVATSDGTKIVFKASDGTILLTVPLVKQQTVTSTPDGDLTTNVSETALISTDGSHAGVYSLSISSYSTDLEGTPTAAFRYYDSTGQLWQVTAPAGSQFYQSSSSSQPSLTPDGTRILLTATGLGNSNPILGVYDASGRILYQSAGGTFDGFYQARLSPNGKFLLAMGAVTGRTPDLLRVFDIDAQAYYDFPFDLASSGRPRVAITADGRFQINYPAGSTVLPP